MVLPPMRFARIAPAPCTDASCVSNCSHAAVHPRQDGGFRGTDDTLQRRSAPSGQYTADARSAELTQHPGYRTHGGRVAGVVPNVTTYPTWGGRSPSEVLGALVLHWRSGTGFAIWGEGLVEFWLRTLYFGQTVSFGANEDSVAFVKQLLQGLFLVADVSSRLTDVFSSHPF
jgi:hypothetical protein